MCNYKHLEVYRDGYADLDGIGFKWISYDETNEPIDAWDGDEKFETHEEAQRALPIWAEKEASLGEAYIKETRLGYEIWPLASRSGWQLFGNLELGMFKPETQDFIGGLLWMSGSKFITTMAGVHCLLGMIDEPACEVGVLPCSDDIDFIRRYFEEPQISIDFEYKQVFLFSDDSIGVVAADDGWVNLYEDEGDFITANQAMYDRVLWMSHNGRTLNDEEKMYLAISSDSYETMGL